MSQDPDDSKATSNDPEKKDNPNKSDRRSSSVDSHHLAQRQMTYLTATAAFRSGTSSESKQQKTAKTVVQRPQSRSTDYLSTTYNNDPMRGIESSNTVAKTTFDQINVHDGVRIQPSATETTIGETSESKKSGQQSDVAVVKKKSKPKPKKQNIAALISHPTYRDFATVPENQIPFDRSISNDVFPIILHSLLESVQSTTYTDTIQWQPHGRSFIIKDKERLTNEVLPIFFHSQTLYSSFHRQLNSYGFLRLTRPGPDRFSFYHELFLRSRPDIAAYIPRTRQTQNIVRVGINPATEPNFSDMPVLPTKAVKIEGDSNTSVITQQQRTAAAFMVQAATESLPLSNIQRLEDLWKGKNVQSNTQEDLLHAPPNVAFEWSSLQQSDNTSTQQNTTMSNYLKSNSPNSEKQHPHTTEKNDTTDNLMFENPSSLPPTFKNIHTLEDDVVEDYDNLFDEDLETIDSEGLPSDIDYDDDDDDSSIDSSDSSAEMVAFLNDVDL